MLGDLCRGGDRVSPKEGTTGGKRPFRTGSVSLPELSPTSIFNRHLVRFVRLLVDPVNCLVRAGKLADTADLPSVEIPEPAVGAPFGTIKFREGYSLTVELPAFLKNLIRADLRTEITTLAPGLVDGEFHKSPIVYYSSGGEKNLFFISIPY